MKNIDVGCGSPDEWIEGDWIRVDPYVKEAEVKAFAWELPYKEGEVDELYSSHMLEHCHKAQVVPTLKEWFRVLKTGGKLTLKVPDFAWCCQWWLDHQTNTWDMDIIFGGQSREGETHYTGFNREIAIDYLREAGFKVNKFDEEESHGQKTLVFECEK
ncbi:MAG: methyltransferase domain-containing protein [Candidatus Curtissbacteria bacterium]|nr:methyltransferase domain-containing protein [Candidatus Curtissbacteria bacterium]